MRGITYMGNGRTQKSEWTVRLPKISNARNEDRHSLEDKGERQDYQRPGDEVT